VPAARLRAVEALAAAGVPVGVMMAPLIPGLTDHEIPALLTAARDAGAGSARFVMLRLPLTVRPVFQDWLARHVPDRQAAIEGLIRGARGGKLNNAEFGDRMRGAGEYAEQISRTFQVFSNKLGLAGDLPAFDTSLFRPPRNGAGQGRLF
jgi:DNA repair photolyase